MPNPLRFAALFLVVAATLVVPGCGSRLQNTVGLPNQRPVVRLESTFVPAGDAEMSAARLRWTATDPDGRVDHYLVTEDPTALNRQLGWVKTSDREQTLRFRRATPGGAALAARASRGFQFFAVQAVDERGETSRPDYRAFFGDDVAPTVQITQPRPSGLIYPTVPPTVWIHWQGSDPDGPNGRPTKYKCKLFRRDSGGPWGIWLSNPDSLRRQFAPGFAGWDSISGDSTQVRLTNLQINSEYLFVITAFDAEGAYDPIFSLDKNMLEMHVTTPGILGPRITLFNEFFTYTYPSGGLPSVVDPSWVIHIQVPAGRPLTVNWYAAPPVGASMGGYRWALDVADLTDESARHNKHDLAHWSAWGPVTSATVGPFSGEAATLPHRLYVEAMDENGLTSLGVVEFRLVRPSFDKDLLVVIDTRLRPDWAVRSRPDSLMAPVGVWPTQAELDTFLFAVGGVRWRMTPDGTLSPSGLFKGYSYDTLGTRLAVENPTIPLDVLGHYRHIVWMTDGPGSESYSSPLSLTEPTTTLRYMSSPNRENTLATWVRQGGGLWALGGGFGNATNSPWNSMLNDVGGKPVYSSLGTRPDLTPGRFMYDLAHWRSEFRVTTLSQVNITRSPFPIASGGGAPNYGLLPAAMGCRDAGSEPLWPNRIPSDFYGCPALTSRRMYGIEYLSQPNLVLEAKNPSPRHQEDIQALDTLMVATDYPLPSPGANPAVDRIVNPVMTCYHGRDCGPVVFSGFSLWDFRRTDGAQLVDGVLQGIWGLRRTATVVRLASRPQPPGR